MVFGFSHASTTAWTDPLTAGALATGVILLAGFVVTQERVAHPLLPLRVVLDRNRGGSYLSVAVSAIATFGVFLFLTYYFQQVKNYSPVTTGLAFLPLTAATVTASVTCNVALLPRLGPRPLVSAGMLLGTAGMVLLSRAGVDSGYTISVLPGLIVLGLAFGSTFGPAINAGTARVRREDAGVASGLANTMQQVGGALGTALLSTLAARATTTYLSDHASRSQAVASSAAVHGYQVAYLTSAGIFLVGFVLAAVLLRGRPAPERREHLRDPAEHANRQLPADLNRICSTQRYPQEDPSDRAVHSPCRWLHRNRRPSGRLPATRHRSRCPRTGA